MAVSLSPAGSVPFGVAASAIKLRSSVAQSVPKGETGFIRSILLFLFGSLLIEFGVLRLMALGFLDCREDRAG